MDMKLTDNTAIILKRVDANAQRAIKAAQDMAVELVQEKIMYGYKEPHGLDGHTEIVDTGKLFDSIKAKAQRSSSNTYSFDVGTDVKYAQYVHDGTRKLHGRPFLRDAMRDGAEKLRDLFGDNLRAGF